MAGYRGKRTKMGSSDKKGPFFRHTGRLAKRERGKTEKNKLDKIDRDPQALSIGATVEIANLCEARVRIKALGGRQDDPPPLSISDRMR